MEAQYSNKDIHQDKCHENSHDDTKKSQSPPEEIVGIFNFVVGQRLLGAWMEGESTLLVTANYKNCNCSSPISLWGIIQMIQ